MAIHISLLQQFSLLQHLPPPTLELLANSSAVRSVARREVVLGKDSPVEYLFFLLEGRLQATDFTLDGKEVGLYFVEEGQYFGEIAMLDGLAYPEIMIANKKSQVVQVPNRLVRDLILAQPQMTEAITIGLAQRVREQSAQRQILSINNPLQRVCAQVMLMMHQHLNLNTQAADEQELPSAPTHQELAMMINLSRETVTRVFQVLQSRGALERRAESLSVNMKRLKELARSDE